MQNFLSKLIVALYPQKPVARMKSAFTLFILIHYATFSLAQGQGAPSKKPLDFDAFSHWPDIQEPKISGDGKCVAYTVYTDGASSTLVLQATSKQWKKEIRGAYGASFTAENKLVLFHFPGDSLGIVRCSDGQLEVIDNVSSYAIPDSKQGRWLAFQKPGESKTLVLRDFIGGREQLFTGITSYWFSRTGKALVLQSLQKDADTSFNLNWIDLSTENSELIYTGKKAAENLCFDGSEGQLAFTTKDPEHEGNRLLYYERGKEQAIVLADDNNPGLEKGMAIASGQLQFSRSGNKVFFHLQHEEQHGMENRPDTLAKVDIWSYSDRSLQSQQLKQLSYESGRKFRAVIHKGHHALVRLEQEEDNWTTLELTEGADGEFVLIQTKDDFSQEHWRKDARPALILVSTLTGKRVTVTEGCLLGYYGKYYSPNGKYVIYFDREKQKYFTYNTLSGAVIDISSQIPTHLFNDEDDHPRQPVPFGVAGWMDGDKSVLIYDRYDIWMVDPDGMKSPVNITNSYGNRQKTVLRILPTEERYWEHNTPISYDGQLLLSAFNRENKYNGFFSKALSDKGDPKLLTMGPYMYYYLSSPPVPAFNIAQTVFLKATAADAYVVTRMNAREFPNLYFSKDLKSFSPLTDYHPEGSYNWMSSELIHWTTYDGKPAEGILFKPENFDPEKKYPVIFYFYEKDANGLFNYFKPGFSDGQINIPYFVSQGYVVCDPNIYYTAGQTRESIYNSVVSAARHLSRFSWVDSSRMGIQGHSFGGFEVNCLVSRTGLFAAAVSAAGFCDLVSLYGNLRTDFGVTGGDWIEAGQTGLGVTLWEKPEVFVKNSPLFYADKVTTPLLIMHNEKDGAAPFSQSVEFFHALRRLQKKVWMLQYDGGSHQVEGLNNLKDYTLRLHQFFDYYLKHGPLPDWMAEGIPARLKGVKTGLTLYDSAAGSNKVK